MRYASCVTASALLAITSAQTFTDCNPTKKTCPNNPALPKTWDTDFTAGKDAVKGWKQTAGSLTYGSEGAEFIIAEKGDAPTIGSSAFLHYGYVEVVMKAAPGVGIISSIVLQSDNLDEVDWEWIGGVDSRVQQNYFGKGNTTTYDRMIEAPVANNQNNFHSYALNWTAESLTWIVDGKPTRTLKKADANGGKNYPQTPCNIRLGNWPGGDSDNKGTREWAGGNVTYSKAPFKMTVKSVKVINYSPGTEYEWSDRTGNSDSIKVIGAGNAAGSPANNAPIEAPATPSAPPVKSGLEAHSTSKRAAKPTPMPADGAPSEDTPSADPEAPDASLEAPDAGSDAPDADPETPEAIPDAPDAGPDAPDADSGSSQFPRAPQSPDASETEKSPCECGTVTVTVTGAPPPVTDAPPATFTTEFPAVSMSSLEDASSSDEVAIVTSAQPAVPSLPPYPTSGIAIDTRPPPSVTNSILPTGVLPPIISGNATSSGSIPEFTGAASHNKAGLLGCVMAGAVLLAL